MKNALIVAALASVMLVALAYLSPTKPKQETAAPAVKTKAVPPGTAPDLGRSEKPKEPDPCVTGDVCKIMATPIISGLDWAPVATSAEAHAEFRKAVSAGDKDGLVELLQTGKLLDTKNGESIRVLDISVWNNVTEGRLTTGKYKGRKVWVTMKWVLPE